MKGSESEWEEKIRESTHLNISSCALMEETCHRHTSHPCSVSRNRNNWRQPIRILLRVMLPIGRASTGAGMADRTERSHKNLLRIAEQKYRLLEMQPWFKN